MPDFKNRIFIGSSREGQSIAEEVAKRLSDIAECNIWYQQFDFGNSAFEGLVNKLSLYDYGVLVATSDDMTRSRNAQKPSPRDNVIFEFGLFAGRLGRQRTFLMAESGIKIPSDLNGITLPFFPSSKDRGFFKFFGSSSKAAERQKEKISECCKAIKSHITKRKSIFDFGFLPSTSLAYGYYKNFVLKAVTNLLETKKLRLGNTCNFPKQCEKEAMASAGQAKPAADGISFTELNFTILIPDGLSADMFDHARNQRIKNKWELIKIDAGTFRPFDFYIQAEKSAAGILELSDIPLTLNALNESIKAYVGKSYIGISEAEELLEVRELRTFKNVLDYLILENPMTKDRVKTEIVTG
jgi:hypothetical protein